MIWSSFVPLCAAQMRPYLNLQFCAPHYKNIELLKNRQGRAKKLVKGLESKSYEDELRELGLYNLEKKRLEGDLTNLYNYLKGSCIEEGAVLCSQMTSDEEGSQVVPEEV